MEANKESRDEYKIARLFNELSSRITNLKDTIVPLQNEFNKLAELFYNLQEGFKNKSKDLNNK